MKSKRPFFYLFPAMQGMFKLVLFVGLIIIPRALSAQDFSSELQSILDDTVRPLYPIVIAMVFLVSALMSIGEIWGDHKNWKNFLSKVGLYVGICVGIVVVFEFLLTLSI